MALKLICKDPPIDILCDTHPDKEIICYSRGLQNFACSLCILPDENKEVIKISRLKAE